jgi:toxin ParE1/3/4
MTQFVLSPRAQKDIDGIWDYTAKRWDTEQANRYIQNLRSAVETVAADPRRGRSLEDIRQDYFKFVAGSHLLIYRVTPSRVEIVRVLHQRMDIARHL